MVIIVAKQFTVIGHYSCLSYLHPTFTFLKCVQEHRVESWVSWEGSCFSLPPSICLDADVDVRMLIEVLYSRPWLKIMLGHIFSYSSLSCSFTSLPDMTDNVFGGMLNLTQPFNPFISLPPIFKWPFESS